MLSFNLFLLLSLHWDVSPHKTIVFYTFLVACGIIVWADVSRDRDERRDVDNQSYIFIFYVYSFSRPTCEHMSLSIQIVSPRTHAGVARCLAVWGIRAPLDLRGGKSLLINLLSFICLLLTCRLSRCVFFSCLAFLLFDAWTHTSGPQVDTAAHCPPKWPC